MKPLNIRHVLVRRVALFACTALFLTRAGADEWPITNHSFETPALSDGASIGSVFGWTIQGIAETHNPNNGFFTGTTDGSPSSPIHGLNAASANNGGRLIYQDASWIITPDQAYNLTFLAGYRQGVPFGTSSVSFWAGTNLLAERFPNPAQNTFGAFSLSYTSPPAGPLIGLPIRIELRAVGADSQPWFDNFHLYVTNSICTPHRATAVAQLVNGVFTGATVTDSGCGYTNAPLVLIQGGGGNGAAATAIMTNGRVVGIRVDNGGCCYTNLPQVVIASPPFVPTLEILVSKIVVRQHVALGHRYVLEYSLDLETWTPAGPSFTATSETNESEFDVNVTGRYFRLREVP